MWLLTHINCFIIQPLYVSNSSHSWHSFVFIRTQNWTHILMLIPSLRKLDMSVDPKPLLTLWHSISILTNIPDQKKNFRLHHDNFPNTNEILYITKSSHILIILHRTASRHSIKLSLAAFFYMYMKTYRRSWQDDWEWQPNHNLNTQTRRWSNKLTLTRRCHGLK